jgi:hypothetical protein
MTSQMFKDQARTAKPLLDEHQSEEFDLRIEVNPGEFKRVTFDSVVGVKVLH